MLRISKLADYGTVVMVYLARRAPELCNARDIAQHTHLSVPTVSKLLKKLTAAGLLTSARGVSGGYRLSREAGDISIAEIIYSLEESRGLIACRADPNICAIGHVCGIQGNWRLISQAIETALESVTLDVLAKPVMPTVDLARIQKMVSGVHRDEK